ncbi:MAG: patatin-like phospholipase family protein [Candidatus Promineifilaceae bacterium]
MDSFRILSIDAGGVRSVYTAVLLNRIAQQVPEVFEETAFFAGSSTGSILAAGLAYGIPPAELVEIFRAYGQVVLKKSLVQNLGQVVNAKYEILALRKLLTPYFGAAVLGDLSKRRSKNLLIPAFDLDGKTDNVRTWKPKIFHNFIGPGADDGEMLVDVMTRSSAMPIDFPSFQGYVDGSLVAVNPSMLALAQALDAATGGQDLANIRLLSIGSGFFPRYIGGTEHDWGIGRWSFVLPPLMGDSQMGVSNYQCQRFLGPNRYFRLAPLLPKSVATDDAEKIPDLISYAEQVDITDTVDWLQRRFVV